MDRCGAHWWTAFENTVNAQVVKNCHYTHNAAQKAKEKAHTCAIAWLRQLSLGQGIMNVESNAMKARQALYCALLFCVLAQAQPYPKSGFVPDETTAVSIAEAVLIPVYGKKQIESERPFKAVLENGVWIVHGTLHCSDGKGGVTTTCVGGTAEVRLSKTDGRILRMIHYK